jgi:hypothetical protein
VNVVTAPVNASILARRLPDAQLVMYPHASHAAHSLHADIFLGRARVSLNG